MVSLPLQAIPKVAVLDVVVPSHIDQTIVLPVTEMFIEEFVVSQGFTVLDRAFVDQILREKEFRISGLVDEKQASELGVFLGADFVVVGRVQLFGPAWYVLAKMIEVKSGVIIAQSSAQAEGNIGTLADLARSVGRKLVVATGTQLKTGDASPKVANRIYKIGIVLDVGGRGDRSFNDDAWEGARRLAETYRGYIKGDPTGVDFGRAVELRYLTPTNAEMDREKLLRVFAQDSYDLIFGIGFRFNEAIAKVANDFPSSRFVLMDGNVPGLGEQSNTLCLSFAEQEGSFLVGAVAGLLVADNPQAKVGFIGGMDFPLIRKFQVGFAAGAAWVNPRLRKPGMILGQYLAKDGGGFNNPKAAATAAAAMYGDGAEIIYHAAGISGDGLFETAFKLGKLAIGVDQDQGLAYMNDPRDPGKKKTGTTIATSMIKRVDQAVFLTGRELIETGSLRGGYRTLNLVDGGVDYAQNGYNAKLLAPIAPQLDALATLIASGEVRVPSDYEELGAFLALLE